MAKHSQLSKLQTSLMGCKDELSEAVSFVLRTHYRATLKTAMLDLQQILQVSSIPLSLLLTPNTRAHSYAVDLAVTSLYDLQRGINNGRLTRTPANVILKQLPTSIRLLLRSGSLVDSQFSIVVAIDNDCWSNVDQIKSALLRRRLFELKNGTFTVRAKAVYKQPLWQEPDGWQHQIWKIRNPHLRGYRLKLLYKDIFSNERRYRFNLSDSPNCPVCGQVETVVHQLFDCPNAQRLWDIYRRITNSTIGGMLDIIMCCERSEVEIIKTVIIKHLIQINRSVGINSDSLKKEIAHFFRLEACTSKKYEQFWLRCIQSL